MGIVKISEQMREPARGQRRAQPLHQFPGRALDAHRHAVRAVPQLRHADICQLLIRIEQAEGFSIAALSRASRKTPSGGRVMARKVSIKSAADIEMARKAGALAAEVLQVVAEHVRPGVTTDELDRICHDHIVKVQQAIPPTSATTAFPRPSAPRPTTSSATASRRPRCSRTATS